MRNVLCVVLLSAFFYSCNDSSNKNFNNIISQSSSSNVVNDVISFELEHPNHFESKLFLAEYFFNIQDYNKSYEYIKRADSVKANANGKDKSKNICKLYSYLAIFSFNNKQYEESLKYINLAIKSNNKEGEKLNYLRGHIYLAQENKTESLKYFDLAYNTYPQSATQTDLQAYMYLFADSDQIENCIKILDFYLQTGKWFLGLGTFASSAYEKLDMLQESILFAFLEYEYVSSFQDVDNTKFIENLNNTENLLKQNNKYEIASPALTLVKSLFDSDSVPKGKIVDNFISNYCLVKYNLQNNILTEQDFSVLLSLEKYFKSFPSYYWTVWNVVKNLDESQLKNYLVILKKIIALNPNGVFAQKARVEIETLFDLKIEDINSLDSLIF